MGKTKANQNRRERTSTEDLRSDDPIMLRGDARVLSLGLEPQSVNLTVTSPPYFDLKDYGAADQIGFGQTYDQYLSDLADVFAAIHSATKNDGSLWIVIDTFRKEQEVLPLPFDLTAKLRDTGWILRDVVIWKKDRTLPWIHAGTTRKIFEYILVLSKSKGPYHYDSDKLRDSSDLKSWWVRYPERYNPRGKSLEEIWTFEIPTQGSWGKTYIRHFCPLPSGLIQRIIQLTTNEGDVVLDPFAGTGTVLAEAHKVNRRAIGFELNATYIEKFKSHLALAKEQTVHHQENIGAATFEQLIVDLRGLKFARTLLKQLSANSVRHVPTLVVVTPIKQSPSEPHKIARFRYELFFTVKPPRTTETALLGAMQRPPLSKFGIQAETALLHLDDEAWQKLTRAKLFAYSASNTHKYKGVVRPGDRIPTGTPILSSLALSVKEE